MDMMNTLWAFLFFCVLCFTVCRVISLRIHQRDHRLYDGNDASTMQDVHRGLQRMEDRVEALETLLIERSNKQMSRREFE